VDPLANIYSAWSTYHYVADNPVLITDPTGMAWSVTNAQLATGYFQGSGSDWKPVVEEVTDSDGNTTDKLAVEKEAGDDAESLAEFLDISLSEAERLYDASQTTLVLPENIPGVKSINKSIAAANAIDDASWFWSSTHEYNCFSCTIDVSSGSDPSSGEQMKWIDFNSILKRSYTDVSGDMNSYIFGRSIMTFGEGSLFDSNINVTHAAIYLGTSSDGTVYTWSKNGQVKRPRIYTTNSLIRTYSSDGFVFFGGIGGVYNRN
jgi:hypothetical protein